MGTDQSVLIIILACPDLIRCPDIRVTTGTDQSVLIILACPD